MKQSDSIQSTQRFPRLEYIVERLAHPLFLASALGLWWWMGGSGLASTVALVISLIAMIILEALTPAHSDWRQTPVEKLKLSGVYLLFILVFGVVAASYEALFFPGFERVRQGIGGMLWPQHWPIVAQVLILYFAADFIYYWIHRAIHGFSPLWRISGHGFHHAFHNLHALNSGATHPFEVIFIALPMILLAAIFGAPRDAVTGASTLLVVNATLAHANLRMNTPVINWFFTASDQHRRHHSAVFAQSNTNFACNSIIWDRLFGTYSADKVELTGIGPQQPTLWQLYWMPFREPDNVVTVSTLGGGSAKKATANPAAPGGGISAKDE